MEVDSSWYLTCVLECFTKTGTKFKSNQESSDQRTFEFMN